MKSLGGYGEGGVVVTNDEKIYDRLKQYRHAGTTSDPKKLITNDCRVIALNHKMDTINAALLLVAMDYLDKRKQARESIAKRYNEELPRSVQHQKTTKGEVHGRYVYVVRTDYRDQLKLFLEANGVETKIMHEPLVCDAPAYRQYRSEVPVARKVLGTSLVIPSHEKLTSQQVSYVIRLFHEFDLQADHVPATF
jgi:dTDP-4-amino-4,6-dideoxygalactose transaminase